MGGRFGCGRHFGFHQLRAESLDQSLNRALADERSMLSAHALLTCSSESAGSRESQTRISASNRSSRFARPGICNLRLSPRRKRLAGELAFAISRGSGVRRHGKLLIRRNPPVQNAIGLMSDLVTGRSDDGVYSLGQVSGRRWFQAQLAAA